MVLANGGDRELLTIRHHWLLPLMAPYDVFTKGINVKNNGSIQQMQWRQRSLTVVFPSTMQYVTYDNDVVHNQLATEKYRPIIPCAQHKTDPDSGNPKRDIIPITRSQQLI
jgi:hypothetical protein